MTDATLHDHDDLSDVDADVVLITSYLAGRLSEFERFAVEKRLEEDEAFFEKVWPLLRAWRMGKIGPLAGSGESRSVPPLASLASGQAAPLGMTGLGAARGLVTTRKRHVVRLWPLLVAAGLAAMVVQMAPRLGIGFDEPVQASLPSLVANGPFSATQPPIILRSGPAGRRLVVLPDSSRITLQPRSWVAYTHDAIRRTATAMIGGEATVDVPSDSAGLTVWTSVGSTSLTRGRYAIRHVQGSVSEMLLTVERGAAILRGVGDITDRLVLKAGDFGRVALGRAPAREAGVGFPEPMQLADSAPRERRRRGHD